MWISILNHCSLYCFGIQLYSSDKRGKADSFFTMKEESDDRSLKTKKIEPLDSFDERCKEMLANGDFHSMLSICKEMAFSYNEEGVSEDEARWIDFLSDRVFNQKEFQEIDDLSFEGIKNVVCVVYQVVLHYIQTFILNFGISELLYNRHSSPLHSGQIIMNFLGNFSLLEDLLSSIITSDTANKVKYVFGLSIGASFFWPWIEPSPTFLHKSGSHMNYLVRSQYQPVLERRLIVEKIAKAIESGRHPLLIGVSRVGKSLAVQAFVQALERGDYPALKKKEVFRFNAADIPDSPSVFANNSILDSISQSMGSHRDNIIIVFDEIHALYGRSNMENKLKTFLEPGGQFPHFIGITTTQEYDEIISQNDAFVKRFDIIEVNQGSLEETKMILSQQLYSSGQYPILEKGILDYIFNSSSSIEPKVQPASSVKVLQYCMEEVSKIPKTSNQEEILNCLLKIECLEKESLAYGELSIEDKARLDELKSYKSELEKKELSSRQSLDNLEKAKILFRQVNNRISLLAKKIKKEKVLSQDHTFLGCIKKIAMRCFSCLKSMFKGHEPTYLSELLVLKRHLKPVLETVIKDLSSKNHISSVIDTTLVDKVIAALRSNSQLKLCKNEDTDSL